MTSAASLSYILHHRSLTAAGVMDPGFCTTCCCKNREVADSSQWVICAALSHNPPPSNRLPQIFGWAISVWSYSMSPSPFCHPLSCLQSCQFLSENPVSVSVLLLFHFLVTFSISFGSLLHHSLFCFFSSVMFLCFLTDFIFHMNQNSHPSVMVTLPICIY